VVLKKMVKVLLLDLEVLVLVPREAAIVWAGTVTAGRVAEERPLAVLGCKWGALVAVVTVAARLRLLRRHFLRQRLSQQEQSGGRRWILPGCRQGVEW
jgi:hypothetical protein